MMYLKAQYESLGDGKGEFRGGIISSSKDVEFEKDTNYGGEVHTYELTEKNFDMWMNNPDDDCIARWQDKISAVWPVICLDTTDNKAYVLSRAIINDNGSSTSASTVVIDPFVFPNGVSDIMAIVG